MKTITVVIPTCRRPEMLARCLEKLGDARDVIVTDDSPDTATKDFVEKKFPRVRWTQGPRRGPAANRNHGARLASLDWLAFLDDDCEPQPGWLDAILRAADGADIVEGKTICPDKRDDPFEEHVENLTGGVLWSCNFAVARDVFFQVGGFDEDFLEAGGEDMEFAWRVRQRALRVVFSADAVIEHPARRITWGTLWKRLWRLRWFVLFRLKTNVRTQLASDASMDLLRTTFHLAKKFDRTRWKAQFFHQAWKWLTFPLVLPCLLFWDAKFRRMLARRGALKTN
jgi:GT2 family glycosyltransferase